MKALPVRNLRYAGAALLLILMAGCAKNPSLGLWSIGQRRTEVESTYVDELSNNIRRSTGATQIEFQKGSIVITGPAQQHVEHGVVYSVQELPSGAVDVRILQPRAGDTAKDIDILHIDPSGNSAQLESPTELVDLTRVSS